MPRSGQIVPSYLHPHVQSYVNDNTIFTETVAAVEEGPSIICVFTSGKGRDGVLLNKTSINEFIAEYGYPNYRVDGQPIYNAIAALSSGTVSVNAMRVMPDDAAYSNIVVLAKVKADEDDTQSLIIKHEAVCHTSLTDTDSLATLTDALADDEPDSEGFITIPLFAFRCLGRGTYGNAFSVRISGSLQSDKENGFKTYMFEVYETSNGIKKVELFEGSLFIDAVTSQGTAYAEDIFNDTDKGSQRIGMYVSPTALDRIYEMYKEINPTTALNDWEFDIINGTDLAGKAIEKLTIETLDSPLVVAEGLRLSYGTDGSFAASSLVRNASNREDVIAQMYVKAFKGELDRTILSKRRMPTLAMFDANYPEEVKRAMVDLCIKRGDFRLYLDSGLITTLAEAIAYGKTMTSIADRNISKEFQHYLARDPYTNKNIAVTTTYFLIKELTRHICVNGAQYPFTGENYAKLDGHIRNTLKPVVDVDDLEMKEQLYELRMNYYEAIAENTFVRATQSTSQTEWSDLSEESNVLVLLEMQNMLEDLVCSLTYNFSSAEDRTRYTEDATRLLDAYQGTKVQEATVYFDMTPWESERSILHCYLAVTFRGLVKRGIIEIDINKRA